MRAVIWTDVFQTVVIFGGLLAVLIRGCYAVGGFPTVVELTRRYGRMEWATLSADPTIRLTVWAFFLGFPMQFSYIYGLVQSSVQRYSAVPTLKDARLVMLMSIPFNIILVALVCMLGLVTFGYYAVQRCDPLADGRIAGLNQVFPIFVKDLFADAMGFFGLFLATLYSGALSTVSSSLSGNAANAWEDILKWKLSQLSSFQATLVNKISVVVFGAIALGLAFLAAVVPGPLHQVTMMLMGSVSGPSYGLFLLGGLRLFKWVEWRGAWVGTIIGIMFNMWLSFGRLAVGARHPALPPGPTDGCSPPFNATVIPTIHLQGISKLYGISFVWYVPLGIIVTMVFGMLVSLVANKFFPEDPKEIPQELFINFRSMLTFKGTKSDVYNITSKPDITPRDSAPSIMIHRDGIAHKPKSLSESKL